MNYRQLQCVITLAQERNFSAAAEKLEISQPALSKQIISLENDLGVKLFDRSVTPLVLTPAGEFFVPKAQALLFDEDVLIKTMDRYRTGENGRLTIGISSFRCLYMMPPVVKALKERFPGLEVVLVENSRAQRQKEILEGQYDFAILNLPVDEARLDILPLEQDQLVLAVPNRLCSLIGRKSGSSEEPIHLSQCANLPFVAVSRNQEMRQLFDNICTIEHVDPIIDVEVLGITTAWAMVQSGVGATIVPLQFARQQYSRNVTLIPLAHDGYSRQPAIVTRRDQYISEYARFAIELLQKNNPDQQA